MPTEGWKASNMYVLVYVLFVNHRYVLKDIETISGLGWFLAWSIGLKLRKVSRKNAITLGNSWILQNSIWERKGKVFLIQIHDLSFRHFFTKRRDKNALVLLLKVSDVTSQYAWCGAFSYFAKQSNICCNTNWILKWSHPTVITFSESK